MTEFSLVSNVLSLFMELLGVLFFFLRLEPKNERRFHLPALLALIPLLLVYFHIIPGMNATHAFSAENLFNQILRTALNWLGIYLFLRFSREKRRSVCGYLAALFVLIYMVAFNLREALHPFLLHLDRRELEIVMLLLLAAFQWAAVFIVSRLLDLDDVREAGPSRWAIVVIPILLELYFKWSLISPETGSALRVLDLLFYSLCATLGVLALVILFERAFAAQARRSAMEMEQLQMQYEMQNAKRALRANTDIRRLYHDMKNHLLALGSMMDGGTEGKEYLKELCSQLEEYEINVHTGNSVADALLAEKMERARLDGIRFNVCVDLTDWSFVRTVDLVTILGNATDNAVEALQMLPEGQERIVYLKSARYANMAVLRISNQFAGKLTVKNGVLRTGKADPQMHGIGLSSIQKAAKRYGGEVETQFENEGSWFRLVIMLPVPEKE